MNDLKKLAIKGFGWTALSAGSNALLTFAVLIIMAKLIEPVEFGKRALVVVLIGITNIFGQFGIAQAIIQKESITKKELDSIFWINVIIGFSLFFLVNIVAKPISIFYNQPDIVPLIRIASIAFIFQPLNMVFRALLEKDLKFDILQKGNISSNILCNVFMVIFALKGFNAFSFILADLIGIIVLSFYFVFIFISNKMWLPGMYFSLNRVKPYYKFGFYVSGKELLNYIGRSFDEIVIGKFLGLEVLGIYNLAKNIVERPREMISHILSKVSFPLYSKILSEYEHRDDKFKKIYLKITNVVSIISFPLIGLAFILTPDIINMLFDNKWVHVAVIMQIFLLKAPIDIISAGFASPVLYSYGKPSWLFTLELFVIPVRLILILIAARISIEAVAITWLIIIFLKSLTLQILVSKISNIPMREYIASLKFAFIGVFIVTIIFYIIKIMIDNSGIPLIVCASVLYCAVYATLLYSLDKKNCRDLIADFKNYASHLL